MDQGKPIRYRDHRELMLDRFAVYRRQRFVGRDELFDPQRDHVFAAEYAEQNLLLYVGCSRARNHLIVMLPDDTDPALAKAFAGLDSLEQE
jgi:hypothetical protein